MSLLVPEVAATFVAILEYPLKAILPFPVTKVSAVAARLGVLFATL